MGVVAEACLRELLGSAERQRGKTSNEISNIECSISNVQVTPPPVAEALEATDGVRAAFESRSPEGRFANRSDQEIPAGEGACATIM
jgi:hypothetical protein